MGNLLSLDPKVHGLRADTKVFGRLFNGQEIFIIFCRGLLIEHHSIASPIYFVILDLGISLDEPFAAMNAWAMTLTLLPGIISFECLIPKSGAFEPRKTQQTPY